MSEEKRMIPEIYADGIGRIGFADGMVRIELVSVPAPEPGRENEPQQEPRARIVMTPHGFLRSLQSQHALLQKLEAAGLVKRGAQPGESQPTPKSPNFSAS
jgi:hypothetical protein